MSFYNRKRLGKKDELARKMNKRPDDVMGVEQELSQKQVDDIIKSIVDTSTPETYRHRPPDPMIIPSAKNTDKTIDLYYRRNYYRHYAFPKGSKGEDPITGQVADDNSKYQGESSGVHPPFPKIDFMYKKAYYGRIDLENRAIFPSEAILKLSKNTDDVFLVNFVADALNDMIRKIEKFKQSGKLGKKSAYFNFTPVKGWTSFTKEHHAVIEALYEPFIVKYVNNPKMFTKIIDFKTFSQSFINFLNILLPKFPLSRVNMQLKRNINPLMTGIVFELEREMHDDDKNKYEKYILDKYFLMINKTANSFGFMIDKNAPWRFVADLESPPMKKRWQALGFNKLQDMFDAYYYQAHLFDADVLRLYVTKFYDSFVEAYPYYTIVENCNSTHGTSKAKLLYRPKRVENPFTDRKLLEFYFFVRAKESHQEWTQFEFDRECDKAWDLFGAYTFKEALTYINDRTSRIVGGGDNPGFRMKNLEGDRIINTHIPSYLRSSFKIYL